MFHLVIQVCRMIFSEKYNPSCISFIGLISTKSVINLLKTNQHIPVVNINNFIWWMIKTVSSAKLDITQFSLK